MRGLVQALGSWAILAAWGGSSGFLSPWLETPFVDHLGPVASSALACAVALLLLAVATRIRWLRPSATLALLGSIVLLPMLHPSVLDWLSVVLVGAWGDCFTSLTPPVFYGVERSSFFRPALVAVAMVLAASVASAALAAVLTRPRAGRVATVVALGLVAALVLASATHAVSRPALASWTDGLPVLARVPVDRIAWPRSSAGDRDAGAWTSLAAGVSVARNPWLVSADAGPEVTDERTWEIGVRSPRLSDSSGASFQGSPLSLACPRGGELVLRALPARPLMLLTCGPTIANCDAFNGGDDACRRRTVVEVHHWEVRVFRFHALAFSAPPPAWTLLGAGGLVVAALILRRSRRRHEAAGPRHPYRAAATPPEAPRGPDALTRAALAAVAVHASAPLVLVAWTNAL